MIRAHLTGRYRDNTHYPAATVNVTNHCNLACKHCFVYRDGNANAAPESIRAEMSDADMLGTLKELRDRHGIESMLWMGGEPLLRRRLVARGVLLFARNTITTNGTVPLPDLGPSVHYVVSLDGPKEVNDELRGIGTFRRVVDNLKKLNHDFASTVQAQCVVTKKNWSNLEELVEELLYSRAGWMTFSFYVPRKNDDTGNAWATNDERADAVREVLRLKRLYPAFVRNSTRSLELMLPPDCDAVTAHCPAQDRVLPLWLEEGRFTTPFCCYGNDVDCTRCGAWVVFDLAARLQSTATRPAAIR